MSVTGLVGSAEALWRYPVKSMMGERVETMVVTEHGILGDRAYALVDESTGNLGSAKNPRKWGVLLSCKARFAELVESDATMPPAGAPRRSNSKFRVTVRGSGFKLENG